jgi:hypothetical protein
MRYCFRMTTVLLCLLASVFWLSSCEKKKEGKVIVTEQEFALRKDGTLSYSLDASGKIKNVGEVDVKKVVITGHCRSCGEVILIGSWFISDLEKTHDQKDTISYLTVGGEEAFSFQGIAFWYGKDGDKPKGIPEKLEIVIESFEVVD